MELQVYNIKGEATSNKVNLPDEVFGVEPNDHAIYLDVKLLLANKRQGTHKAKERSEVSGSTRKLHKQKGTGGSRKGDINSPLFPGGGRVFGPRPRNYSFKLNKKLRIVARRSALSYKAKLNQITIIEDFTFDAPKTKYFENFLNSFNVGNSRVLLLSNGPNKNVALSCRNLDKVYMLSAADVNTYELIKATKVFIMSSSIQTIQQNLG